ncbi:MAG: site-specific integrase, partial [Bythopirellula sp.]
MKNLRKKLQPRRQTAGREAARWQADFADYLRSECHLADNTVEAYARDLARFFQWLGNRRMPQLRVSDLAQYPAWLAEQGLAPKSITRHVASLKVFFRFLQLEGALTDNQAELLGTQKLWQRVPEVLSEKQVDQLLAAPRKTDRCWLRDRAILELLYATGARVSE